MVMALVSVFLEIIRRPTIGDVMFDLLVFMVPIWAAVLVGVVVGWAWKLKWVNLDGDFLDSTTSKGEKKKSALVFPQFAASMSSLSSLKWQVPTWNSWISDFGLEKEHSSLPSVSCADYSSSKLVSSLVNGDDLKHLRNLVE